MSDGSAIIASGAEALLALAGEQPYAEITLRAVALRAGVPLPDLYAAAPSRIALLARLSADYDRAALSIDASAAGDLHDRLFDAVMARIEAMAPRRETLIAISRSGGAAAIALHAPATARAILAGAGLEASPPRTLAMTLAWLRIAQVWRDDEGALNRTMAEVDIVLKRMRRRLALVGAGF